MERFELLLFSTDPGFIRRAVEAGIDGVIVDWENAGKRARQEGADTQVNLDTLEDLARVRAATQGHVLCRINGPGPRIEGEVEAAIEAGADEILVPMVRAAEEVEHVLDVAMDRCGVSILVETLDAVANASQLAALPLHRVYVGLNDLAIERQAQTIFDALIDGTVEGIREMFDVPFGFGGLTLPDGGYPIPCRLLIAELARLECRFSFLRRSFHRDIQGRDVTVEVSRIRGALDEAAGRSEDVVRRDRNDLQRAVHAWGVDASAQAPAARS